MTTQSLIERYGLNAKLPSRKGKERDPDLSLSSTESQVVQGGGGGGTGGTGGDGKGKWEDTREKRERELKERKERMILEARRWVFGSLDSLDWRSLIWVGGCWRNNRKMKSWRRQCILFFRNDYGYICLAQGYESLRRPPQSPLTSSPIPMISFIFLSLGPS